MVLVRFHRGVMDTADCRGRQGDGLAHLVVYPLVDFQLVVQHHKRLRGDGVSVEDETEVTALALHVDEVSQGCVQSVNAESELACVTAEQCLITHKTLDNNIQIINMDWIL